MKSGAVVKQQGMFVVLKTTSNTKQLLKSGAVPLYRSLVTSLHGSLDGATHGFITSHIGY